jgi:hypothetical protein
LVNKEVAVENSAGLLESWVGKHIGLLPAGDSEPWVALLEGWDERGVMLRFTEEDIRADELEERYSILREPCLLFFPWSQVSFMMMPLADLGEG